MKKIIKEAKTFESFKQLTLIRRILILLPLLWGISGIFIWTFETYILGNTANPWGVGWSLISILVFPIIAIISLIAYYSKRKVVPLVITIPIFLATLILVAYLVFVIALLRSF